jgi:hypothetical protein
MWYFRGIGSLSPSPQLSSSSSPPPSSSSITTIIIIIILHYCHPASSHNHQHHHHIIIITSSSSTIIIIPTSTIDFKGHFNVKSFSIVQYQHMAKLQHGDFSWIIPGKFIAFSGPLAKYDDDNDDDDLLYHHHHYYYSYCYHHYYSNYCVDVDRYPMESLLLLQKSTYRC